MPTTTLASRWRVVVAAAAFLVICKISVGVLGDPAWQDSARPACHFVQELPNGDEAKALLKRCLRKLAAKTDSKAGQRGVHFHDRRCGVTDANTTETVERSDLCLSSKENGINRTFIHTFYLTNEYYFKDYENVRKRRFRAKKTQLEKAWNTIYLNSSGLRAWGFDRIILLKLRLAGSSTGADRGVMADAAVQFSSPGAADVTAQEYKDEWLRSAAGAMAGVQSENSTVTDPLPCPGLETASIPDYLEPATTVTNSTVLSAGTTLDLTCRNGTQLTRDSDQFDPFDYKYTLLCSSLQRFNNPWSWPTCVPFCPREMPPIAEADLTSGLEPVLPEITVPAGQFGMYVCADRKFGVNKGPSAYLRVLCRNDSTYETAPAGEWPACEERTTTVNPVISNAIRSILSASHRQLEYRVQVVQWKDGDEDFVPDYGRDWATIITIPSFFGFAFAILLCCVCTRTDSPVYKLCRETNPLLEKKRRMAAERKRYKEMKRAEAEAESAQFQEDGEPED